MESMANGIIRYIGILLVLMMVLLTVLLIKAREIDPDRLFTKMDKGIIACHAWTTMIISRLIHHISEGSMINPWDVILMIFVAIIAFGTYCNLTYRIREVKQNIAVGNVLFYPRVAKLTIANQMLAIISFSIYIIFLSHFL